MRIEPSGSDKSFTMGLINKSEGTINAAFALQGLEPILSSFSESLL